MRLTSVLAAAAALALVAGGVLIASGGGSKDGVGEVVRIAGRDPISGAQVALDDFAGKPVVLNVWASWCKPCAAEAGDLARLAASHPEIQLVGLDDQDTTAGARAFYRKWKWTHPSIADVHGAEAIRLGVPALPTTFFLDREHRVVSRIVGPGALADFEREVAKIATA